MLADESGMPARAAGGDENVVEAKHLFVGHVETTQLRGALLRQQTAAHAVLDGGRLLEDLLEHEVVEPAALDLIEIPIDLADAALQLLCALVENGVALAREYGDVSVIEVDHFAGLREDRRDIAGDVVFAVAETDKKRTSLPRRDNLVRSEEHTSELQSRRDL